ncbi:uncharacterized protein [Maniola hyperantus]|uniref:uncharacterized protein n=1 Tax=Aphantopus hyperantus TaxID=2795564 RepID=UPI001569E1D4|nr:uncharacterized protein LOC117991975 [Maniola hyperantus]
MKFFLALAFLTVVCAIPRPGQISATRERVEQLASIQGSGQGDSPVGDAKGEPLLPELESSADYIEDDDDDISENISLDDLINLLHRIRHAIQKKIHSKLSHYKDSGDDIYVTSERVPVHEDSANETAAETPQQGNRKRREGPGNNSDHRQNSRTVSNNTKGNNTASDHKPQMNITQIKKEIHDIFNDIIENVFRPWLGSITFNPSQQGNKTVVDNGSISNVSRPTAGNSSKPQAAGEGVLYFFFFYIYTKYNTAPQIINSTELEPPKWNALNETESEQDVGIANDTNIPQEANNTELPPNGVASNEIEGNEASNDLVEVNSNIDMSSIVPTENSQLGSEVPQNVQASDESTSEIQVRLVN